MRLMPNPQPFSQDIGRHMACPDVTSTTTSQQTVSQRVGTAVLIILRRATAPVPTSCSTPTTIYFPRNTVPPTTPIPTTPTAMSSRSTTPAPTNSPKGGLPDHDHSLSENDARLGSGSLTDDGSPPRQVSTKGWVLPVTDSHTDTGSHTDTVYRTETDSHPYTDTGPTPRPTHSPIRRPKLRPTPTDATNGVPNNAITDAMTDAQTKF